MNTSQIFAFLTITVCFGAESIWGQIKPYDLTVGVMLPFDDPYLKPLMGYETSAGAVTLALDRVKRENLLPGANIR